MTLFHTCCETLHRSGGGIVKVHERRTVVGGGDWPLDWPSISLHGWGDTRVSPQPWREIDEHAVETCIASVYHTHVSKTQNTASIAVMK